ncbi:arogenate dehydratase/prephenate dehydratase 1, chloroplastic-like [Bidens hawaiensis]|uniref:arogenate dehydratase/prephenate dehydratase 1, chloroplastic-like n=1 Tax=Bidens hawaiensis TaxID=980011 RepID=UPI00404AFE1D
MSSNVVPTRFSTNHPHSKWGVTHLFQNNCRISGLTGYLRVHDASWRKWSCLSSNLGQSKPHLEDEKPSGFVLKSGNGGVDDTQISKFHKDLSSLPKALSSTDLVPPNSDNSKVRVAYKGVPGAYSEAAALKAYPKCETIPCEEYESVFMAVELWFADKGIIKIEDSVGESIHRNYDLVLRHRLHILGEVNLSVDHCLLGLPGVQMGDLKCVLSHQKALDQYKMLLNELNVVKVNTEDTAAAAQVVASKGVADTGAIASSRAAEIYGLHILSKKFQDDLHNVMRFLILAREPIIPGVDKPYKTSIVFTLEEGSGQLFNALAVFALRDINLSKIESRPQRNRPLRIVDGRNKGSAKYFDYFFYIDFEASMAEPRAQCALGHLQEFSSFLRVLGCYPIDTNL